MTPGNEDYHARLRKAYRDDLLAAAGCLGMIGGMFVLLVLVGVLL